MPLRRGARGKACRPPGKNGLLLARLPAEHRAGPKVTGSGFTARGRPEKGLFCNPAKLLLDPYAKAIDGQIDWNQAVFPYYFDKPEEARNEDDSGRFVPKCIVVNPFFDWDHDEPLRVPWQQTIVYETHVKGLTARNPEVPEEIRGTYAGLAHPAVVGYLKRLGVTAVELLPVHQFIHQKHLIERGDFAITGDMTR